MTRTFCYEAEVKPPAILDGEGYTK